MADLGLRASAIYGSAASGRKMLSPQRNPALPEWNNGTLSVTLKGNLKGAPARFLSSPCIIRAPLFLLFCCNKCKRVLPKGSPKTKKLETMAFLEKLDLQ